MISIQERGFSANRIKCLALAAMFTDHLAYLIAPDRGPLYTALHFIGAAAAPVLFYFAAEGYRRTRSVRRYLARLALFAAVSYVPFLYFFEGQLPNAENFLKLNVLYTIFLGVLALRVVNGTFRPPLRTALLAAILALSAFGDWGYMGVLMILAFDRFRGEEESRFYAFYPLHLALLSLVRASMS